MQTSFTDKQLENKDNKSSETILRKCVHCGMCNATCPTYGINGDELEGPRGRIYLIKDMLENNKPANQKIAKHIDSCLSCYSCMTTCPSGVNYMHLIDHGRNYVEETYKRPFLDRTFRNILSFILPKPNIFLILAIASKVIKPFSFLFPQFLKNSLNLMPNRIPSKKLKSQKVYSPKNNKIVSRVALLTGCVQRVIAPEINEATIRLLNRHNVEVVVMPDVECCGSLNHHLGKKNLARISFVKNIESWHQEYLDNGLDAIISNTSGCGTTLKDYGHIFKNDKDFKKKAKKISDLTKDIAEYLHENLKLNYKNTEEKNYKVAYHSACSMQHGQKIHDQPKELISKTGSEVLEIPEGHLCCGSAGTYNILHQKMAKSLLRNKVKNIEKVSPDFISTGNVGCITQISTGTRIPLIHTVELLDWFTGGPKPYKLRKL
jgi:glycolate oxidase iron-sulfur subunit